MHAPTRCPSTSMCSARLAPDAARALLSPTRGTTRRAPRMPRLAQRTQLGGPTTAAKTFGELSRAPQLLRVPGPAGSGGVAGLPALPIGCSDARRADRPARPDAQGATSRSSSPCERLRRVASQARVQEPVQGRLPVPHRRAQPMQPRRILLAARGLQPPAAAHQRWLREYNSSCRARRASDRRRVHSPYFPLTD